MVLRGNSWFWKISQGQERFLTLDSRPKFRTQLLGWTEFQMGSANVLYSSGHVTVSPPMVMQALVLSLLQTLSDATTLHSDHEAQLLHATGQSQFMDPS